MIGAAHHSALKFSNHLLEFEVFLAEFLIHFDPKLDLLNEKLFFEFLLILGFYVLNFIEMVLSRPDAFNLHHHVLENIFLEFVNCFATRRYITSNG